MSRSSSFAPVDTPEDVRCDFMIYVVSDDDLALEPNGVFFPVIYERLRNVLGANFSNTAVFILPGANQQGWLKCGLILPNQDGSGTDIKGIFNNASNTKFYSDTGSLKSSLGNAFNFSISEVPEFRFVGLHHIKNLFLSEPQYLANVDPIGPFATNTKIPEAYPYIGFTQYFTAISQDLPPQEYIDDLVGKYRNRVFRNVKINFFTAVTPLTVADVGGGGGGGGGFENFVQLLDVNIAAPQPDQALHYNAVSSKWEQTPEVKVDATTRNFNVVTEGAIGLVNNSGSSNIAIQAGGEVLVQGETAQIISDGLLNIESTNDLAQIRGQSVNLRTTPTTGTINLITGSGTSSVAQLAPINKSAVQYATDITNVPAAIPNVEFVNQKVGAVAKNYVDLEDVDVPTPQSGLLTHFDSTDSKFKQIPEIKVDPTTRVVDIETTGALNVTSAAATTITSGSVQVTADDTVTIESTGGGDINISGIEVNVTANSVINMTATGDDININANGATATTTISGQFATLIQSNSPDGRVILRSGENTTASVVISTANKSTNQYAIDVDAQDFAVPNVKYVKDKIAAIPAPDLSSKVSKGGDTDNAPLIVGTNDSQPLQLRTDGTPKLTIENSGKIVTNTLDYEDLVTTGDTITNKTYVDQGDSKANMRLDTYDNLETIFQTVGATENLGIIEDAPDGELLVRRGPAPNDLFHIPLQPFGPGEIICPGFPSYDDVSTWGNLSEPLAFFRAQDVDVAGSAWVPHTGSTLTGNRLSFVGANKSLVTDFAGGTAPSHNAIRMTESTNPAADGDIVVDFGADQGTGGNFTLMFAMSNIQASVGVDAMVGLWSSASAASNYNASPTNVAIGTWSDVNGIPGHKFIQYNGVSTASFTNFQITPTTNADPCIYIARITPLQLEWLRFIPNSALQQVAVIPLTSQITPRFVAFGGTVTINIATGAPIASFGCNPATPTQKGYSLSDMAVFNSAPSNEDLTQLASTFFLKMGVGPTCQPSGLGYVLRTRLGELSNVASTVDAPTAGGHLLTWDGVESRWFAAAPAARALNDLSNVDTTGAVGANVPQDPTGQALIYNGTEWKAGSIIVGKTDELAGVISQGTGNVIIEAVDDGDVVIQTNGSTKNVELNNNLTIPRFNAINPLARLDIVTAHTLTRYRAEADDSNAVPSVQYLRNLVFPPSVYAYWDDNVTSSLGTQNAVNWLQGTYVIELSRDFTILANNTFRYDGLLTGGASKLFEVEYFGTPIVGSNDRTIWVTAYKNPSAILNPVVSGLIAGSRGVSTLRTSINDTTGVANRFVVSLAPNDTVRFYVSNRENNDAITMTDWRIKIKTIN